MTLPFYEKVPFPEMIAHLKLLSHIKNKLGYFNIKPLCNLKQNFVFLYARNNLMIVTKF